MIKNRFFSLQSDALEFSPEILKLQEQSPSPLPRMVLYLLLSLFGAMLIWATFGRLDVVAVGEGRLVPQTNLKIIQPTEQGIVRELLIKEGDEVKAGQVLARMDTRLSEADSKVIETELKLKNLQLRRIEAELGNAPLKREVGDPAQLYNQVEAQYFARRGAYENALAEERAVLSRTRQDLQAALEVQNKLKQTLPLYREQEEGWNKLAAEGYAGKLMAQQRSRERIEKEQDLAAQNHNAAGLKATVEQSSKRLAQITANYQSQLQNERVEVESQHNKLQQDWVKQQHRHTLLELKAPQDGIIKDLATHTQGSVVSPGAVLMTLVPKNEPLHAEVWLNNQDVGFVRSGQAVRVKLSTFPFQKYGMVDGSVTHVSADSTERPAQNGNNDSGRNNSPVPFAYRAVVALKSQFLENAGARYTLLPGMQVAVEIKLRDRTVMEYLLSPVQKAFHEAGRER